MRFFVLTFKPEHARGETEFYKAEPIQRAQAPKCEACGCFIGALKWLPPFRAGLELWDNIFGDIAFGPGDELLVSERFKALWEERGLTGLDGFHPIEVVAVQRHKRGKAAKGGPPPYYCVTVVRSKATIDEPASGLVREHPPACPLCRGDGVKRTQRIVLEPSTWSGEDVFIAHGLTGTRLASERFRSFFDDYKITSAVLISADEYSFDFYPDE